MAPRRQAPPPPSLDPHSTESRRWQRRHKRLALRPGFMQVGMMANSILRFVRGVKELTEHLFRLSSSAVGTAGLLRPSTAIARTGRTSSQDTTPFDYAYSAILLGARQACFSIGTRRPRVLHGRFGNLSKRQNATPGPSVSLVQQPPIGFVLGQLRCTKKRGYGMMAFSARGFANLGVGQHSLNPISPASALFEVDSALA